MLGFLKAGRVLDSGSSVLLLGTLFLACAPTAPALLAVLVLALAVGLLAKYLAWRVALDAEFFTLLHEQPGQASAFDAALAGFLNRKTVPPLRTMQSRWLGARRLVRQQAAAVALQAGLVLFVLACQLW
ncbi:MAG TPA: hypothetical protein VK364_12905 [Hymenobacter sp.]|nr:hypothetical protein [Hymenobacter sp.]